LVRIDPTKGTVLKSRKLEPEFPRATAVLLRVALHGDVHVKLSDLIP